MARVVFMGSSEFSVPSLLVLMMAHQLVGVVTQPDRPAGRGRKLSRNPVARMARASGIPLYQPATLRTAEALDRLTGWKPDLVVVAAFGQILLQPVLDLPLHGCINVHASLLPRWRGAAPTQAAIMAGETETGVTIMQMDAGLDTGPILARQDSAIEVDDTAATLGLRLAEIGAQLLVEVLPAYLAGDLDPVPQPEQGVTYAPQLSKADGEIDWALPAERIDRHIRACTPWPGAFTRWRGETLKIVETIPLLDWSGPEPPGTVLAGEVCPMVATGSGALWLTRLQLPGKKVMASDAFICGRPDFAGSVLAQG